MSNKYICDSPKNNVFCGHDKYLRLIKHSFSERSFPVLEDDSYFLLVKSGYGKLIINGVEFEIEPGCVCWLQCSHVLTIAPAPGQTLKLWSVVYDYQLSNFFMFRTATRKEMKAVVAGWPLLHPGDEEVEKIGTLFGRLDEACRWSWYGASLIQASLIGQISVLFAQGAEKKENDCIGDKWPMGWRCCIYIAAHSTIPTDAITTAKHLRTDVSTINRELRMVTGMNYEQFLSRLRCIMASSYFLYENLPLDYVASHSGFKSEVTFYRSFKKSFDMTPREYRDCSLYDQPGRYRGLIMDETLVAIVNYLYNNLSENISVESMSKALYVSSSIIRSVLESAFGTGYKRILNLFRIRYSESLLASTNLPILDISVMVGFSSDRTYSRIFNSINGLSPSEYRQLCRKNRGESNG